MIYAIMKLGHQNPLFKRLFYVNKMEREFKTWLYSIFRFMSGRYLNWHIIKCLNVNDQLRKFHIDV